MLVIIDTLFRLIRFRDGNDYASVSAGMEPLTDLARRHKCHLMFTHHEGKGERTGVEAILGSTALFGAVDTGLNLYERHGQGTLTARQRYGPNLPPTTIVQDPATGLLLPGGAVPVAATDDLAVRLRAVCTESRTTTDLYALVRANRAQIHRTLTALVAEGALIRLGSGTKGTPYRYLRADSPSAPPFLKEREAEAD